jgi:hypothetical protein
LQLLERNTLQIEAGHAATATATVRGGGGTDPIPGGALVARPVRRRWGAPLLGRTSEPGPLSPCRRAPPVWLLAAELDVIVNAFVASSLAFADVVEIAFGFHVSGEERSRGESIQASGAVRGVVMLEAMVMFEASVVVFMTSSRRDRVKSNVEVVLGCWTTSMQLVFWMVYSLRDCRMFC